MAGTLRNREVWYSWRGVQWGLGVGKNWFKKSWRGKQSRWCLRLLGLEVVGLYSEITGGALNGAPWAGRTWQGHTYFWSAPSGCLVKEGCSVVGERLVAWQVGRGVRTCLEHVLDVALTGCGDGLNMESGENGVTKNHGQVAGLANHGDVVPLTEMRTQERCCGEHGEWLLPHEV